ncbi:MAG: hypothetical protein ABSG67_18415 [Thermoguttaceae bacterium]
MGDPAQLRAGIIHPAGKTLRLLVVDESGDMIGKRRALVVDYGIFGGGQDFAFDQFGPAFQLAEHRPSGGFVPASGRHFLNNSRAVPILGGVGSGDNNQPVGSVFPYGNRCRSAFFFRVDPLGKPFAFADNDFSARRQRFGRGFFVDSSHDFAFLNEPLGTS